VTGVAREHPTSPRAAAALELIRGGYGALQLALPGLVADRLLAHRFDPRGRRVARVLGARQLVQALGSGRRPSYPVLAVGVEVDLLHAASMLGLGLVDRRRRRVALADAVIAGSFALAGTAAARGGQTRALTAAERPGPAAGQVGRLGRPDRRPRLPARPDRGRSRPAGSRQPTAQGGSRPDRSGAGQRPASRAATRGSPQRFQPEEMRQR